MEGAMSEDDVVGVGDYEVRRRVGALKAVADAVRGQMAM